MNQEQVKIMREGKGFIAALDQSGGSTPKALAAYGIPKDSYDSEDQMFDLVHEMRTRLITCPSFDKDRILAAILFEQTMDRDIEGKKTADYLWDVKGIVPFLKVDKGLAEEKNGVQLMKPMPGLDELLKRAVQRHIFGTKMRSNILAANREGIRAIVDQQFEIAEKISQYDLVPIIEPEVNIHIEDKKEAEAILKEEILSQLEKVKKPIMLKLTIPSIPNFYKELIEHPMVLRVVALSGGYSREEANVLLAENHGLIASFSRALVEGLSAGQSDEDFAKEMKKSVDSIYEASIS